jgi:1-acyl-sn-glycerol-3-phosphate acyltransferase
MMFETLFESWNSFVKQKVCHYILFKLLGWRMIGEPQEELKYIFVGVPHTSNWDFFYGWLAIQALDLNVKIFAEDVFFIWPINHICAFLGVLPANRRKRTNVVDSIAEKLDKADQLRLLITPEGTRTFQPTLKSGYYHLARKANVPIVLAGPNFTDKTFTIMPSRMALASFAEDQAQVIEFCKKQHAYHPQNTFQ